MKISDLKNNMYFELKNKVYKIIKIEHSKQARSQAVVKAKVISLPDHKKLTINLKNSNSIKSVYFEKVKALFSYSNKDTLIFFNSENYDSIELSKEFFNNDYLWLTDNMEVILFKINNNYVDYELPINYYYYVVESFKAVKGNSETSSNKIIKIQNNIEIKVPLFIEEKDKILINIKEKKYLNKK